MRVQALLWTLVWLLAGCASIPSVPSRPAAQGIAHFAFLGRLAVKQGETRYHANIDWRHEAGQDTVLLTTPLGQGLAELVRDAAGARVTLADRRSYAAADGQTLARQVFGFDLPLGDAARWLRGLPADTEGWRITVVERESAAPDALPILIELERDDIVARLKIDEWTEAR